jgi:hypothetical protein
LIIYRNGLVSISISKAVESGDRSLEMEGDNELMGQTACRFRARVLGRLLLKLGGRCFYRMPRYVVGCQAVLHSTHFALDS